jgi:hypothetical protein
MSVSPGPQSRDVISEAIERAGTLVNIRENGNKPSAASLFSGDMGIKDSVNIVSMTVRLRCVVMTPVIDKTDQKLSRRLLHEEAYPWEDP